MLLTIQKSNTEIELLCPVKKEINHYIFSAKTIDQTNIKRPKENNFVREVEVIYLGRLKSLDVFQLLCIAVDFSGDHLEDVPLLRKINYVFDEVVVSVNEMGKIVQVNNHNEILSRWQDTKVKLQQETEGSTILNYFDTVDRLMGDLEKLIGFLNDRNMYGLYFNGYWGKHSNLAPRVKKMDDTRTEVIEVFEFDQKDRGIELHTALQDNQELYNGRFYYQDHQLMEAVLELNELDYLIKYNVLCLGLRKY